MLMLHDFYNESFLCVCNDGGAAAQRNGGEQLMVIHQEEAVSHRSFVVWTKHVLEFLHMAAGLQSLIYSGLVKVSAVVLLLDDFL